MFPFAPTDRRRNVLVLILRHLVDYGYVDAYEKLSTECNLSLNKVIWGIAGMQ